ncbi:TIGR04282 family arsenosugar biosynthesis glycosyltransferase [Nostoc sp. FACHB-87]|uniref:TIGR04282 family arsenosugar biosynthesis glycosyltransferase n=1 Tax=Nostocaceae TaxID=1162 RepID=UPI001688C545|nr:MULTISPECIES: TIGR04282 family arsenosugar biosynthesis glycosyltransferase [Nostocaceae]MBD2453368.1 TIGR04282 family arsenosugar biosynthesis glycosyltransferase [Nostoc sp. FACHB-87]MBD2475492.1 TIGR04282 family arsenosugar biosynthesis glycosyltransferase [Anabaena sp. FACHB-83]
MLKLSEVQKQHLIIFTRYPEPGKTKTRLIPALGSVGAAHLQQQMTEYTLLQVGELQKTIGVSVEVRFAGGSLELMQDWLGGELLYASQGEGDLGKRMARSLVDSFRKNAEYIIIIGSDCPGLTSQILATAFQELQTVDLVLGPAIDGGYYLIGVRRFIPELFANIDWGTSQVLQQTVDIAADLGVSSIYLPTLADVDRPEDLSIWQEVLQQSVYLRKTRE